MIKSSRTITKRRGFTLIELLVVIAIITLLLAIGSVGINAGRRGARKAAAQQLLMRIEQACEGFKNDFNDYPPLVTIEGHAPTDLSTAADRLIRPDFQRGSEPAANIPDRLRENRYGSVFSLAVYLVGVGDLNGDGVRNYGETDAPNEDDGADGPGVRAIGKDGFWGLAQNPARDAVANTGRIYGPYLEPGDLKDLLVEEKTSNNQPTGRFIIVDRDGHPIRYYRHWPIKDSAGRASLKRVPAELRSLESLAAAKGGNDDKANDIDRPLLGAEFALLATGYDGQTGEAFHTDLDSDLDLSSDAQYAGLRRAVEDNLRVLK